jgi:hypothetical protein
MSPFFRFAVALCLSLAHPSPRAFAAARQELAGAPLPAGQIQSPATTKESAPAEQAPAQTAPTPPEAEKSAAPATAKKSGASSTAVAKKRRKRPAPAPDGAPKKIVVREGGASEPDAQIEPDITPAEAARKRQNAMQLLGSADFDLKLLAGRTLDADQQETVGQIRNYMDGVRTALKEGDVGRANTLAEKAHLLAEDLAKH